MSVYIETSAGDVVVDLYYDECPIACKNFLKLCKIKYYHNCLFLKVARDFIAQTGDPTNTGTGGSSIYGLLDGDGARFFKDEILPELRHVKAGMLGMVAAGEDANASQFYVTLAPGLDSLDGKHTLFAEVVEDEEGVVAKLNGVVVDEDERPLQNVRIRRTEVLDDPFEDPDGLAALVPAASPEPQFEQGDRIEEDWRPEEDTRSAAEIEADLEAQKAENRRVLLEMIGDRPFAEAKAEENYLFVCKLNPVTEEADLETIFSRFGQVVSCDIVRDRKTGESLNYAFIGFETKESAEEAYLKMNGALVDDRRIKVDFSQSMYHQWKQFRRFGAKSGSKDDAAPRDGDGQGRLLAGGKFRLKSGAHGYGVGAGLGLVGRGGPGHGNESGSRARGRHDGSASEDEQAQREGPGGAARGHGDVRPRSGDAMRGEAAGSRRDDRGAPRSGPPQQVVDRREGRTASSSHRHADDGRRPVPRSQRDGHAQYERDTRERDRLRDGGQYYASRSDRDRRRASPGGGRGAPNDVSHRYQHRRDAGEHADRRREPLPAADQNGTWERGDGGGRRRRGTPDSYAARDRKPDRSDRQRSPGALSRDDPHRHRSRA